MLSCLQEDSKKNVSGIGHSQKKTFSQLGKKPGMDGMNGLGIDKVECDQVYIKPKFVQGDTFAVEVAISY